METTFTPFASLAGGLLIGLAAVLLMALHGRIAGATGILSGIVLPSGFQEWVWRAAMVAGMASAPTVMLLATGALPEITVPVSLTYLIVGGVIVGFGASLGNGCTSGHGVCGMARLSPRSIAATLVFMATTATTVFVIRHGIGG
ncbi:MAG: YeeE/YedE family protein [Thalassobaculum sp.]